MKVSDITIGADIEVFLKERYGKNLISAVGLVPGTKDEPEYIDNLGRAVQTDNVSVEFLIPICFSKEEFNTHIAYMLKYIDSHVPGDLTVAPLSSGHFDPKELQSEQAQLFGCEPDFNAWTKEENPKPSARSKTLRSNGFHVHIGYDKPTDEVSLEIVKALDLILGVPATFKDPDMERKQLYGKAGAHRLKPYGVEYRVLSSYFAASESRVQYVWDRVQLALDLVNAEFKLTPYIEELVIRAINKSDIEAFQKLNTLLPSKYAYTLSANSVHSVQSVSQPLSQKI